MQIENLFQNMSFGGGEVPSPKTTTMLSQLSEFSFFEPSARLIQALNELSNFQMLGQNAPDDIDEQFEYRIKEQLADDMMIRVQTITGETQPLDSVAYQFLNYVKERERSRSLLPGSTDVLRDFLSELKEDLKREIRNNVGEMELKDFASTFWQDLLNVYFRPLKEGMEILQYEYDNYFRPDYPDDVTLFGFSMNELYNMHFPHWII